MLFLQPDTVPPFSPGKVFTFLFLMLGPFKIIGPFAAMTAGRDRTFKHRLALEATIVSAIGTIAAVMLGTKILRKWGVSVGALLLTAGIVLFLVALQVVLDQYAARDEAAKPAPPTTPETSPSELAFSPLAFPTIITPYGVAVLIVLVTLRTGQTMTLLRIAGITAIVLALDFLAMLSADRILNRPMVRPILGILGSVLSVLQAALGVQAMIDALHLLGVIPGLATG